MIRKEDLYKEYKQPPDKLISKNETLMWIADNQMGTNPHTAEGKFEYDVLESVYEYVKDMDGVTQCDVVDCCEDCPRYADDCDGDKYLDRYPTMHEYAEGKRINPKLTDLISRADAIKAVASITMSIHLSDVICDKLLALPSADARIGDYPNDLISRSALMEYCSNQKSKSIDNNDIARFPSADAVQGEWIYGTDPITGEKDCMAWTCSLCGGKYPWQPNYCPSCGARMKGGAE